MCSDQEFMCCGHDGKGTGHGDFSLAIRRNLNGILKAVGNL